MTASQKTHHRPHLDILDDRCLPSAGLTAALQPAVHHHHPHLVAFAQPAHRVAHSPHHRSAVPPSFVEVFVLHNRVVRVVHVHHLIVGRVFLSGFGGPFFPGLFFPGGVFLDAGPGFTPDCGCSDFGFDGSGFDPGFSGFDPGFSGFDPSFSDPGFGFDGGGDFGGGDF
jgi:hypothetical protein